MKTIRESTIALATEEVERFMMGENGGELKK